MVERLEQEVYKLRWEKEKWVEREEMVGNQLQICERNWKEWAEKEVGDRSRKIVVSEPRKWQAKGKALLVDTASVGTQSDHIVRELGKAQVEVAVQTEVEIEKKGAGDSEDVVMADRLSMYEDLSAYEDEEKAPVVATPTTKKQAAPRPAAKAGKKSLPAKIPPQRTPPNYNLAKAVVIHGVPCQRSMADIIQEMGVRGIMGARWLLGGNRRMGKATSSVVVFFHRKLAVGSHLKMRGRWLPIEAYDCNRGWICVRPVMDFLVMAYHFSFTLFVISHSYTGTVYTGWRVFYSLI
ncbi:hypothetical protein BGX38DRAFT_1283577 [Terfezia claveryi]|nr:hypothetical protein BGX38DRAFT_1283577 [Terfezia claveryi]